MKKGGEKDGSRDNLLKLADRGNHSCLAQG